MNSTKFKLMEVFMMKVWFAHFDGALGQLPPRKIFAQPQN